MSWHPQRRLPIPGGSSSASLKFSVLIFLAAIILTGILDNEAPGFSQSGLARPLKERRASREEPVKSAASASTSITDRMGDHYLMLVNTAMANQLDVPKMAQFDRSPYDGLAVSFAGAYDPSPVLTLAPMQTQIASWKKSTRKDIWPWVYLNRMIGANDAEGNPLTKVPYFQRFQGLDLDGKAGAQNDFLENWRNALRLAKQTGVPGIVCDLEFYNNYKAYDLAELARMGQRQEREAFERKTSAH
jgi:hypothetical protein